MSKVRALDWVKTSSSPERWEGRTTIGRVYVVTQGACGWVWRSHNGGWHESAKGVEPELGNWQESPKGLAQGKMRCQEDWEKAIRAEVEV